MPLYIVLDCGHNMLLHMDKARECIAAILKYGRKDRRLIENLWISFITTGDNIEAVVPLQELGQEAKQVCIHLLDHRANTRDFDKALLNRFSQELRKKSIDEPGDWRPLVLWISDGSHEELEKQSRGYWDRAKWPADFKALNCSEDDTVGVVRGFQEWISDYVYPKGTQLSRRGDDERLFERLVREEKRDGLLLPRPPQIRITM